MISGGDVTPLTQKIKKSFLYVVRAQDISHPDWRTPVYID
jgi:hypothetical protein